MLSEIFRTEERIRILHHISPRQSATVGAVATCHGAEEDDLFYCVAARLPCFCGKLMAGRSRNRRYTTGWLRMPAILAADRTVPGCPQEGTFIPHTTL